MKGIFNRLTGIVILVSSTLAYSADTPNLATLDAEFERYQLFSQESNWKASLSHARAAYELGLNLLSADAKKQAELAYHYGVNLSMTGDLEGAQEILTQAVDMFDNAYHKNATELIPVYLQLGKSLAAQSKVVSARKPLNKALKVAARAYGKNSADHAQTSVDIGAILFDEARSKDAEKFLERGYKGLVKTLGKESPITGRAAHYLGKYEFAGHYFTDALEHLNEAFATFEDPDRPATDLEIDTHSLLAQGYVYMGQTELATRHCLAVGRMRPFDPQNPLGIYTPKYIGAGEGTVMLRFDIDENGYVRNLTLESLDGSESIVKLAIESVAQYRYAPRFVNGQPVETLGLSFRYSFNQIVR